MITEAGKIRTIYGVGCIGMGCGGLGDGEELDATDTGSDIMPLDYGGSTSSSPNMYGGVVTGDPVYTSTQAVDAAAGAVSNVYGMNLNTTNATTATGTSNPTGAVNAIANAFTSIFKAIQPLPAGCTQIQNVYGTSTQCTANGAASTLNLSGSTIGGLSITTILLLAGGVLLFMNMGKKG